MALNRTVMITLVALAAALPCMSSAVGPSTVGMGRIPARITSIGDPNLLPQFQVSTHGANAPHPLHATPHTLTKPPSLAVAVAVPALCSEVHHGLKIISSGCVSIRLVCSFRHGRIDLLLLCNKKKSRHTLHLPAPPFGHAVLHWILAALTSQTARRDPHG
jgi:hypothetical protein